MKGSIEDKPLPTRWEVNPKVITGVVVIALGLVMLVATFTDSQLVGQMIVLLLGLIFLAWGVTVRHPGPLIPGCILSSIGVGILLSQWLFAGASGQAQGGIVTLCLGLGFLLIMPAQQVITGQNAHWWPLIPGGILSLTGFGLLLGDAGLTMLTWMGRLWPLALIAVGLALLYQAVRAQHTVPNDQPFVTPSSQLPTLVEDPTVPREQGSDAHEPAAVS